MRTYGVAMSEGANCVRGFFPGQIESAFVSLFVPS